MSKFKKDWLTDSAPFQNWQWRHNKMNNLEPFLYSVLKTTNQIRDVSNALARCDYIAL